MSEFNPNVPVYLVSCESYDKALLTDILREAFNSAGITKDDINGRKVVIKPNLVLAKKPDFGATTHPATVEACADLLAELGAASIILADSPGGPYNAANLGIVYRVCEMAPLASDKLKINGDYSWQSIVNPEAKKAKNFHCITPVFEADVIVDLCKLKTHSLTVLSGATKNLFGVIPGVEKFEMHSTYPKIPEFSEMLVDIAEYLVRTKTFISICDGILAMEGNGPTHGTPKNTGLMLVSRSPFALDIVAEHIIKADGEVIMLDKAAERGLVRRSFSEIELIGDIECPVHDFVRPDSDSGKILRGLGDFMGGRFAELFEVKPKILKDKCIGCGKCESSCPRHTISMTQKRGKKIARIDYSGCIRCYCCQELCPIGAVGTKQNFLIRLIH